MGLCNNGIYSRNRPEPSGTNGFSHRAKMQENVDRSLMLAAALNPSIGYENAAKTVKKAHAENISLKDACVALGFLTEAEFDRVFHPEDMV